jgi:hypothetical protein
MTEEINNIEDVALSESKGSCFTRKGFPDNIILKDSRNKFSKNFLKYRFCGKLIVK